MTKPVIVVFHVLYMPTMRVVLGAGSKLPLEYKTKFEAIEACRAAVEYAPDIAIHYAVIETNRIKTKTD